MRKREQYKGYTIVDHEGEIFWVKGFTNVEAVSFDAAKRHIDRFEKIS